MLIYLVVKEKRIIDALVVVGHVLVVLEVVLIRVLVDVQVDVRRTVIAHVVVAVVDHVLAVARRTVVVIAHQGVLVAVVDRA